ncbi:hypothetical protein E3N88_03806 [Mikania micrantha]|uniref:Uncharacterized protein n=1 Tax=Mikania micrantha TaxID=192012 RepID=A0A5N6PUN7_9ASTR|nr:hypothetical protein E3N88_03806 [Mikania micrantha]
MKTQSELGQKVGEQNPNPTNSGKIDVEQETSGERQARVHLLYSAHHCQLIVWLKTKENNSRISSKHWLSVHALVWKNYAWEMVELEQIIP